MTVDELNYEPKTLLLRGGAKKQGAPARTRRSTLGFLVFVCLACPGCDREKGQDTKPHDEGTVPLATNGSGEMGASGLNVLLISVDTTRADHLGCYGHPVVKTPNVDRLAARGTRFDQCISSAPLTLPSHATMLTGSYQFVHGVRDNVAYQLSEENVTLAEIFQKSGYRTVAEVAAGVMDARYGLGQGFDVYGDVETRRRENAKGGGKNQGNRPERTADDITRRAIGLLSTSKDRSFFMFLHYFDPHADYVPPERFRKAYADGYLAEIAFFDEQLGLLLDELDRLGLTNKTLVILTSDHGEELGKHGVSGHSYFVYDATQHVPLIVSCPRYIPAGQVVQAQVRLIDIAPTIVEFVGLSPTPTMQGVSLIPFLRDPNFSTLLPCYGDTLAGKRTFGYSALRFIRADGWKYIHSTSPELYDLAQDPQELSNVVTREPKRAASMLAELRQIIADSPEPPGGSARHFLGSDELRKLRALGYVGGEGPSAGTNTIASELESFDPTGVSPKVRVEVLVLLNNATAARNAGRFADSEAMYRRLLTLEPTHAASMRELADVVAAQKRDGEAMELYRRTLKLDPSDYMANTKLGGLLSREERFDDAEPLFRRAITLAPDEYLAYWGLAELLINRKRIEEALAVFQDAAQRAPEKTSLLMDWGQALRDHGDLEKAREVLVKVVALDHGLPLAHLLLADVLHGLGHLDEAVQTLEPLAAAKPNSVPMANKLAEWYVERKDYASAAGQFRKVVKVEPANLEAWNHLGLALVRSGEQADAIEPFETVIAIRPEDVPARVMLADLYVATGDPRAGLDTLERVMELAPKQPSSYLRAAEIAERSGDLVGSMAYLRRGRAALPNDVAIANNLAWQLATSPKDTLRNGDEAVRIARQMVASMDEEHPSFLDTLAAAYAEAQRFDEAVSTMDRAMKLATQLGNTAFADDLSGRRTLYQNRKPYRAPTP